MDNNFKQGITFPIRLEGGSPINPTLMTSVGDSVRMILGWPIHRRAFNILYGSTAIFLHSASVLSNYQLMEVVIRESVLNNEPRVQDVAIKIVTNDLGDKVYVEATIKLLNNETINTKTII